MWERVEDRLALLELFQMGTLRRRIDQAAAWQFLAAAPWIRLTGRRDEIALREGGLLEVAALLARLWPGWELVAADLEHSGLSPTPRGWEGLADVGRLDRLPTLPDRVNRHTLAAMTASHAKAAKGYVAIAGIATKPMRDDLLRIRSPAGLALETCAGRIELDPVMHAMGEVGIPERAMTTGLSFIGPLEAILLVENLGMFCDLPAASGWMYALVPGWNTPLARHFLASIGDRPIYHSPDLDPNGMRIHEHLKKTSNGIRWFCPPFAAEYIDNEKKRTKKMLEWPESGALHDVPPVVKELAARGLWIEQEVFALDPRMPSYLAQLIDERGMPEC